VKLIVGLGNPGDRYRGTRHNVGFDVVDLVAKRRGLVFGSCAVDALLARERGLGATVMLAKPTTYMNLSGVAVRDLCHYYRIDQGELLVVADDVNLPLGKLRARRHGSDGGHNGFGSIIEVLSTAKFDRLRLGVGRRDDRSDLADYVLDRFSQEERKEIDCAIERAAFAIDVFLEHGTDTMMEQFNRGESPDSSK
jgi:PTH1 family peptidyl-tRNA hydrolase|tara:strand:- start:9072 stop:9656 length:585 start_codon:yes stop_codon:yes gene_type:complete